MPSSLSSACFSLGAKVHGLGRVLRWKIGGCAGVFSALLQEIWHVEDTVYGEPFYFVKLKQVLSSRVAVWVLDVLRATVKRHS